MTRQIIEQGIRVIKAMHRHGIHCGANMFLEHMLYNYAGTIIGSYDNDSYYESSAESNKIIRLDPNEIKHYQPSLFRRFADLNVTQIQNPVFFGNWDRLRAKFQNRLFYRSLEAHFVDGVPWEETILVQRVFNDIEAGTTAWHQSTTRQEVFERCETIDEIYESIKRDGFKSQRELGKSIDHEVTVNIDRNGGFIQSMHGKHRLALAKLLDIDSIPVRIFARHHQWERTRNSAKKGKYQHPDLV